MGASAGNNKSTFSPYRELGGVKTSGGKRSPAKIRIAAAVKNQPYRNQHNSSKLGGASQESEHELDHRNDSAQPDVNTMTSMERLEPYLKANTPMKPMKNFVSTVSYLRPATENKQIVPQNAHGASHYKERSTMQPKQPQRLQSAGTLQGNYAANRVAKKRA